MSEREVVFVDGVRTAFGKMGGAMRNITAEELGGIGIRGIVGKNKDFGKGACGHSHAGIGRSLLESY